MNGNVIEVDFKPRHYFEAYHSRDKRWSCIVAHRRAGKTVATVFDLLTCALGTPEITVNVPAVNIPNRERAAWENNYVILDTRGRGH